MIEGAPRDAHVARAAWGPNRTVHCKEKAPFDLGRAHRIQLNGGGQVKWGAFSSAPQENPCSSAYLSNSAFVSMFSLRMADCFCVPMVATDR